MKGFSREWVRWDGLTCLFLFCTQFQSTEMWQNHYKEINKAQLGVSIFSRYRKFARLKSIVSVCSEASKFSSPQNFCQRKQAV